MDNSTAQKLLTEWQNRLYLQEWIIKLNINCTNEETENNAALTVWQEVIKTACIHIVSEEEYGDDRIVGFDFEKTLVHELLHLKLCLLTDVEDEMQARVGHMEIDSLARAFVDAKRSGREGKNYTE